MAVLEVKMISGWVASISSLIDLIKMEEVRLQKYEIDPDGTVQLYFNEVPSRMSQCLVTRVG